MNESYTKLYSTITASSIWRETKEAKILWVTMLAMADRFGDVSASIPGLAAIANLTIPECETALKTLLAPDTYSRSREFEGRRIEEIEGGWHILNHAKYRERRDPEKRREQNRKAQQRFRCKKKENHSKQASAKVSQISSQAEAEAEAEAVNTHSTPPKKNEVFVSFEQFWSVYPRKENKKAAQLEWKKLKPNTKLSQRIIEDVIRRNQTRDWLKEEGKYIPLPKNYLAFQRWTDELPTPKRGDPGWLPDEADVDALMNNTDSQIPQEQTA